MKPNAVNPTIFFSALNLPRMDPEPQLNWPYAGWVASRTRDPAPRSAGPCSLLAGAPPASRDGVTAFDET